MRRCHSAGASAARLMRASRRSRCSSASDDVDDDEPLAVPSSPTALSRLGDRIKALQSGEAKAELRGVTKAKAASGVRKGSARRGARKAKGVASGGFGK